MGCIIHYHAGMFALLAQASASVPASTTTTAPAEIPAEVWIEHPAGLLAVLLAVLAVIFWMAGHPRIGRIFKVVPTLVFCYFVPTTLTTLGILPSESPLYDWIKLFVLPAALLLLILALDLPGILRLGPKAVVMLLAGTTGVVIGGPISLLICKPWLPEDVWRGMAALAGSWIGGGANFVAIGEAARVSPGMLGAMVVPDVFIANVWMGVLLYLAGHQRKIDAFTGANAQAIHDLERRMTDFQERVTRIPKLADLVIILAFGFLGSWLSYRAGVAADDALEDRLTVGALVLGAAPQEGSTAVAELGRDPPTEGELTLTLRVTVEEPLTPAAESLGLSADDARVAAVDEHMLCLEAPGIDSLDKLASFINEHVPGWTAELSAGAPQGGVLPSSDLRQFSPASVPTDGLVLKVPDAGRPGMWNFHTSVAASTWKFIIVTALGVLLSFTPARNVEGAGASKVGSVMIYLLVACIGATADFAKIVEAPALILMGAVWMAIHVVVLLLVGWLIKAPIFFIAVGSQANIGGAASAPVVASAFHPSLAPVGALLAVAGYVLGTYAGLMCMQLLKMVS
ncbi:MAG: DUF819 family protein [Planctomycetota bacterium]|jgi:uncharacterized membrane protein